MRKEKDKNIYYKKNNIMNETKTKILNKKINKEIELNANKNESNKFYEDDLYANRVLKTENNNINIEEDSKMKRTINSKNNTTVNTITHTSNARNSKNHKNFNNINNLIGNDQKLKIVKQKKNYVVDFNGHKRRINIVTCKRNKKILKVIKKLHLEQI